MQLKRSLFVFRATLFAIIFTVLLIIGSTSTVFGAQLDARLVPEADEAHFEIKYQRTIFIEYPEGGALAEELRGVNNEISITADSSDPGVQQLIKALNDKIAADGSSARITDMKLDYSAKLLGRNLNTAIDYKIILDPTLSFYQIREYSEGSAALVDAEWRGLTAQGSFVVDGQEINLPISAVEQLAPGVLDIVQGTEGETLLKKPIINAEGIKNQPLSNWHFLFDPTGINVDAGTFGLSEEISGFVVSSYTMGESSIREGRQVERVEEVSIVADKPYELRSVQSSDTAEIKIIGFANLDDLYGAEVFGVSPKAPEGSGTTSTGEFPVMIIYGMAGMAVVGGVAVMFMSNRKLKAEEGLGQQGIDPSQLQAYETSAASGGYQTTRGEAQLKGYSEHDQTRSVYDVELGDTTEKDDDKKSSTRGSMPKGWKPE